jgi:hypothetical protein
MTTVAGACTRAGYLPAVLRSAWVRRERPAPGPDREEHRPRHRGARRQPAAGSQVLSHRLLHGRRDHVELPKVHPTQVNKAATKQVLLLIGTINSANLNISLSRWWCRLSGVAIVGPVGNYWWSGLPSNVSWDAWYQQLPQDQWAVWVAHHLPWLTYWWNSQRLFPASSVIAYNPALLSEEDKLIIPKFASRTYMVRVCN